MSEDSKYQEEFNKNYLPYFTEYFSQTQMEKKIESYQSLIEDIKKIEKISPDSNYQHVMTKKVLFLSKNAKIICRNGIQYKHIRNIILKLFNIEFSPEDYNNKAKTILKGRSFSDLEGNCPSFSPKTFEETLPFHYLNEKGVSALKEVIWLLNGVLPKIDYCPTILSVGSLLLLFLSKEETYEVLRNIIESDQNEQELNRLRWHFRYTVIQNIQLDLNIKSCILELSSNPNQFKNFEKLGLPFSFLIRDIIKKFFLDYINFAGIIRFLPFFLLEGVKGIYRLIYAIICFSNLLLEEENLKDPNDAYIKEKKTKEELLILFKEKSNKIKDIPTLIEFATKWNLTHINNNYIYQSVPIAIKNNIPQLNNLFHIPSFKPESQILSKDQITKLWDLFPNEIKLCNCILLYKKEENNKDDLNTIYELFENLEDKIKIMLIIETNNEEIFGFIMKKKLKLDENIEYKAVPMAYLYSVSPELKFYEHKNKADEIICVEPGVIRFGKGNEGDALVINYDLNEGVTDKNSVFGNDICLIKDYDNEGFFNIKKLEIYLMQ